VEAERSIGRSQFPVRQARSRPSSVGIVLCPFLVDRVLSKKDIAMLSKPNECSD
jgi:hypothetical protein